MYEESYILDRTRENNNLLQNKTIKRGKKDLITRFTLIVDLKIQYLEKKGEI